MRVLEGARSDVDVGAYASLHMACCMSSSESWATEDAVSVAVTALLFPLRFVTTTGSSSDMMSTGTFVLGTDVRCRFLIGTSSSMSLLSSTITSAADCLPFCLLLVDAVAPSVLRDALRLVLGPSSAVAWLDGAVKADVNYAVTKSGQEPRDRCKSGNAHAGEAMDSLVGFLAVDLFVSLVNGHLDRWR
jgi:hypothetical protein